MAIEFRDIIETEKSPTGKILREKLSCGHWVETAKRGLQVMNLKTKVLITKRTCKDCLAPTAKTPDAAPRARPAKKSAGPAQAKPAAPVPSSTTGPAGPPKRYREPKEAPRIACPGCEGVVVCSSGCPVNRWGTWRMQDLKDAARRLAAKKAEVAGPMAVPGLEPIRPEC